MHSQGRICTWLNRIGKTRKTYSMQAIHGGATFNSLDQSLEPTFEIVAKELAALGKRYCSYCVKCRVYVGVLINIWKLNQFSVGPESWRRSEQNMHDKVQQQAHPPIVKYAFHHTPPPSTPLLLILFQLGDTWSLETCSASGSRPPSRTCTTTGLFWPIYGNKSFDIFELECKCGVISYPTAVISTHRLACSE